MAANDSEEGFGKLGWIIVSALVSAAVAGIGSWMFSSSTPSPPKAQLSISDSMLWTYADTSRSSDYRKIPKRYVSDFDFYIKNESSNLHAKNVSVKVQLNPNRHDHDDSYVTYDFSDRLCSRPNLPYFVFTCGNIEPGGIRVFLFKTPQGKPGGYIEIYVASDDYTIKEEYRICDYWGNVKGAYYIRKGASYTSCPETPSLN
jgi:hypothetical protein